MFADGHAVALHSGNRWELVRSSKNMAGLLTTHANRIESLAGTRPCRAFRPHGGWRSYSMYKGLREIDYRLIGWGWMLWDVDPLHARTADRIVDRIAPRVRGGDIIVMHDGNHAAPREPQPHRWRRPHGSSLCCALAALRSAPSVDGEPRAARFALLDHASPAQPICKQGRPR
jgi:peptidoglycan/xylan/chitin deacetylase (PgdA/CDA1 family)